MSERIPVSAAVLIRRGSAGPELLSARRTEPAHLAGGWEFPGGKWDEGEDAVTALRREIMEELGVDIDIIAPLAGPLANQSWPMADTYALHVFIAEISDGQIPELREQHDDMRWLSIEDPMQVAWLEVDIPPLTAAIEWLRTNYA